MNVELIEATENPEELVCTAARNDYRAGGVTDEEFRRIMSDVDAGVGVGQQHTRHDKTTESRMRTLMNHLMDSGHWGPFEHPQATVALEGVTRVLMAQLTRHRHFTFDVQSLRYVEIPDVDELGGAMDDEDGGIERLHERLEGTFHFPDFEGGTDVSREGVEEVDVAEVERIYRTGYLYALNRYRALLDAGVAAERARKVLPMGVKVNIVVSGSARAWMHVLNVRTKANVQEETRECANAIFEELKEWMPHAFGYYDSNVLPLKLNP